LDRLRLHLRHKTKAIEYYEKFLSLWKDVDPNLPEVADARERVAAWRENRFRRPLL
jgi:hypothetical protein